MTQTHLHNQLEELFQLILGDETIRLTDNTQPQDLPGWDSVAYVNLMFSLEQTFGVTFRGNELATVRDIAGLKQLIEEGK
ncbi:MAG: acyl carrier protein [Bryobacteraceae bacterium]|nr:acyl carrier protein [Bryobacteraceae bacterium]